MKLFYTYVLWCTRPDGKQVFYVGSTSNIDKRLKSHLSGSTKTTRQFEKIELVYYEACINKSDAIKRELSLKTGFGRGYLKNRLKSWSAENKMHSG